MESPEKVRRHVAGILRVQVYFHISVCDSWFHAGIPVRLTPFSMMYSISPSVSDWVCAARRSGGFGYKPLPYIVSPLPSFAWHDEQ